MKNLNLPTLDQFFGGYMHQDCYLDYDTVDEAIEAFATGASVEYLESAIEELGKLIELARTVQEPKELLYQLGCQLDPVPAGVTVIEWLQDVEAKLSAACQQRTRPEGLP
jgi:hypothetical protein